MKKILLLGVALITHSFAMEDTQDSTRAIHTIGSKMQGLLQPSQQVTNYVFCPMGVSQTLALLHPLAERKIQKEIEGFSGDAHLVNATSNLNQLLASHSKTILPQDKWDTKKYILTNGAYALIDQRIPSNQEIDQQLQHLGAKWIGVDFANAQQAAKLVNGIVHRDTHGKIPEILSPDAFSSDSVFVLLHTLYINATWKIGMEESVFNFADYRGKKKFVKAFEAEGKSFQFSQKKGVTLLAIPTIENCHVVIRHTKDPKAIQPITEQELNGVLSQKASYTRSVKAPFVSMTADHNLKKLLSNHLLQTLKGSFQTKLSSDLITVADYIQKVTFDMTDAGVEASAATAMHCMTESCGPRYKDGPILEINSPFSFTLSKTMDGKNYPLFLGEVVDHTVTVEP